VAILCTSPEFSSSSEFEIIYTFSPLIKRRATAVFAVEEVETPGSITLIHTEKRDPVHFGKVVETEVQLRANTSLVTRTLAECGSGVFCPVEGRGIALENS